MILNGFNSDDYRYFKRADGSIFKYRNDQLASALFNYHFLPYSGSTFTREVTNTVTRQHTITKPKKQT